MKIPGQVLCARRPHRLLGSAARAEGVPKSDRKGRARNAIAGLGPRVYELRMAEAHRV